MTRGRVVVVGIDGVRWDHLGRAEAPWIRRVGAAGFLAPVLVHPGAPTISGPCWSTIATGTLPAVHGVRDNDDPPRRASRPADFLRVAADAGLVTFAAAGWPPLLAADGCGPIFAVDGVLTAEAGVELDLAGWDDADRRVTDAAASALADDRVDAAFVYLGAADEVAHARGTGPDYRDAIETCDRRLGQVLRAVGAPGPSRPWTVIVVTDHGHRDEGGHGGDSPAERTAWVAACGPGVPTVAPAAMEQADVAAQVLATLGLGGRGDPASIGMPFGTRRPR